MGVAEFKRRLAEVLDAVADGGRVVVTRRGRPVAALVPAPEAEQEPSQHLGLAAFAGALSDFPEFEQVMAEVIASRRSARDRDVPELEIPELE